MTATQLLGGQNHQRPSSQPEQPNRIAIVGAGFSGMMVAAHLLKNAAQPLTVYLIDRQPKGTAYRTPWDCHYLNVPASNMSAFADDPSHFWRWAQQAAPGPAAAQSFLPRRLYGEYLEAVLAEAIAHSPAQLKPIADQAVAIAPQPQGAVIRLASGAEIAADQVVLAIGNFPSTPPPLADSSFYRSSRYLNSPWSADALANLPADQPIVLIGSGLTAIDVVLALHQQGHSGKIHLVSRRGLLPQPHRTVPPYSMSLTAATLPQTARSLLQRLRLEVSFAAAQGYDWRSVVDGLRPANQALWQQLPLKEQRRFLRHLRPYWDIHRHRVAPTVAATIEQLRASQQLLVQAGRIQAIAETTNGAEVVIRPRGCREAIALSAAAVVNCTGPEGSYERIQHPLVVSLREAGLIQPHPLGLGLAAIEGAVVQADGRCSTWLYTLGPPQKGCLWETTAVPELRSQAQALAATLLKALSRPKRALAPQDP